MVSQSGYLIAAQMQRQPAGVAVVAMFPSVLTEGGRELKVKIKIVKRRKG